MPAQKLDSVGLPLQSRIAIAKLHVRIANIGDFQGVKPFEPCRKKVRVWESAVNRFVRGANLERVAEDTADCQLAVEEAGARGRLPPA